MCREMESLPEDVLRQAALEKGPSGCATKRARIAQEILWERLHWPCADAPSQHVDRHGNKYTKTGVRRDGGRVPPSQGGLCESASPVPAFMAAYGDAHAKATENFCVMEGKI